MRQIENKKIQIETLELIFANKYERKLIMDFAKKNRIPCFSLFTDLEGMEIEVKKSQEVTF
jgi:hypothetical protein